MSAAVEQVRSGETGAWMKRLGGLSGAGQKYGALATLLLLVLLNALFTPNFATAGNAWNILLQVSTTVLVGLGMTMVLATGGVDLSVGSLMAVASAVAAMAMGSGAPVAILGGLAAATALGTLNGLLIARYRIEPFLVTLAMQITGRGLAQVITNGGQLVPFTNPYFEALGKGYLGPIPAPVVLAAGAVGTGLFVMRFTSFGRYLLAVGGNPTAAHLAGVNVNRVRMLAYTVSGLLAGLAGLIDTARLGATDPSNIGAGMEFAAIAGAVIGGTALGGGKAQVFGTVLGVLILAVIAAAFNMLLIPFTWALLIQAGIILTAVYMQRPRLA